MAARRAETEVRAGVTYAQRVVAGKEPAGKWVRLACQRFLDDLDVAKTGGPWRWSVEAAARPILFAGMMTNIKGPEAGQPIMLMPWQKWALANLFGFVNKAGLRRFRQASVWVPRGNGKSSLAACLCLYLAFVEGEGGAETYTAAVSRDQARVIFDTAREMAKANPGFRREFGIVVFTNAIVQAATASSLKALASDARALDGLNVHFAVLDEIGSHKTGALFDVLVTALGKRLQPLLLSISTATDNVAGVGKRIWDYTEQVLRGGVDDDRFFGVLYAADPEDAWNSERVWRKANPGWGRLVQPDHLRGLAKQAQANPAQRAAFETRHLNRWVSAENPLFDVTLWDQGAWPTLELGELAGEPCFVGLDMGSRVNLAAGAVVFRRYAEDDKPYYIIAAQCWLPQSAVNAQRNPAYVAWAETGALAVNQGETTDYEAIEDWLRELARTYDVRQIAYDPYMLQQLSQRMLNEGLPMLEYRATVLNFSEPTKLLGAAMLEQRITHNGNPVLRWCVGNVVGHYDARQNVYPRRGNEFAKINAAIALVMAFGAMLNDEAETAEIYKDHDLLVF